VVAPVASAARDAGVDASKHTVDASKSDGPVYALMHAGEAGTPDVVYALMTGDAYAIMPLADSGEPDTAYPLMPLDALAIMPVVDSGEPDGFYALMTGDAFAIMPVTHSDAGKKDAYALMAPSEDAGKASSGSSGGCSCREAPSGSGKLPGWAGAFVAIGAIAVTRRRRRRP
jgi:MYXO-CTERM domain-containing protein